ACPATLALLMHYALCSLSIGLPLAGWLILSAAGKPIPFFGLELPPLVDKTPDLAGQIKEWHETIGNAGYFLIGLHAAGALFHHFVSRDNTLVRMLPQRR
ncbi:cytochrome b, partial [Pseudomonas aeruginosa]